MGDGPDPFEHSPNLEGTFESGRGWRIAPLLVPVSAANGNQGQILEKGKGAHEGKNLRVWEGDEGQVERVENGEQSMQRGERDPGIVASDGDHIQAFNIAKGENRIHIRGRDEMWMANR